MERYDNSGVYFEKDFERKEEGKANLETIAVIGTGLLALVTGATLLKLACDKYLPEIYRYFNFYK